ncbi:hypothetical protein F5Y00DRAFT_273814 [Daldinia vernicosa]|uniref:uncharacterized protein n=1 Tax=Daldinia vernicosa TaxID=114800 RepID=UPI00200860D3|nr:uncharacterized protein F5Y00DRAFT_273814 [Daldinia vernicosa]KAI0852397.1 hypothetical protein F5Y00DRAFT_273814 [Daldinia vernicosa]
MSASNAPRPKLALSSADTTQVQERPPRRCRTSKPKVKTGCNNCKQRRIKCDEQRPACTQCVRSKRDCTGYPPPPRTRHTDRRLIAPAPKTITGDATPITPTDHVIRPVRSQPQPRLAVAMARPEPQQQLYAKGLTPPQTPVVPSSLTVHRPSLLTFDPIEGLYFQLFRERTASELSGFFDSSFWTRNVLQECHSEKAIRHSVVALGALYKTLEKMSESPPNSPAPVVDLTDNAARHWEVAFKHYSLALDSMRVMTSQDQASQRMSLMAAVLLACFDSFIGDHKLAIRQIQSGLRLLENLRAQRRNSFLPKPEEPVEQDLVQMFTRLAIQAKSYDMAFHFPQPFVIRLTPEHTEHPMSPLSDGGSPALTAQPQTPDIFQSLLEARVAWDNLCEQMMRFTENMFTFTTAMSPMGVLPNSLRQYGTGFADRISAWSRAFDPILSSRIIPAKSSQEKTAIAVLKMNQIMGEILFYMTFSDTELQFDTYLPQFKDIVNLAVEVVGDEERRAAAKRCPNPEFCHHQPTHPDAFGGQYTARHIKPSFSADLGIVPPLFVVATKCRDSVTRRQAIQLLRTSSRREGMWDSELAARIGMWIMEIEEGDDGADDFGRPTSSSTDMSRLSTGSPSALTARSPSFGNDIPLGPGGNARWAGRRESVLLSPHGRRVIPEERRVMVRAVEFDLRERVATIQCGTRGLIPGMRDPRTQATRIRW